MLFIEIYFVENFLNYKIIQYSKTSNGILAPAGECLGVNFRNKNPLFRNTRKQGGSIAQNSIDDQLLRKTVWVAEMQDLMKAALVVVSIPVWMAGVLPTNLAAEVSVLKEECLRVTGSLKNRELSKIYESLYLRAHWIWSCANKKLQIY